MGCDFEVEMIRDSSGGYQVNVISSPAGEASGKLEIDVQALLARRPELQSTVLASSVTSRADGSLSEEPVREIGNELFSALFTGPVYGRYAGSLAAAAERGDSLRVVLRLQAPELAALPWEMMFDQENGNYVCQAEPLLRYMNVPSPIRPLQINPPLRILGLIASPSDLPALDVEEEKRRLGAVLDGLGDQVELVWADGGGWMDLQHKLLAGPWHIVHFIGHGGFRGDAGVLALVHPRGTADYVSAGRFTTLLSTASPQPRLVVLNSCSSGETGAGDLFSSTAAALVRSGVPAAVAMQFAISDPAAAAFAGGFYAAIASNRPISEAVRIGRIAIIGSGADTLEWVTPILCLRGPDTALFTVSRPAPETAARTATETAQTAAVQGKYIQALGELRHRDYDAAITLLDSVLSVDPHYRDAAERRDKARAALRDQESFGRGEAAERKGDWDTAAHAYSEALTYDPEHPDAAERRDACLRLQNIADLEAELAMYERQGNDPAAEQVRGELTELKAAAESAPERSEGAPPAGQGPPPGGAGAPKAGREPPSGRPPSRSPRALGGRRVLVPLAVALAAVLALFFWTKVISNDPHRRLMSHLEKLPWLSTCQAGKSDEASGVLAQEYCKDYYPQIYQLYDSVATMNQSAKGNGYRGHCIDPPPKGHLIWREHSGKFTGLINCQHEVLAGNGWRYNYCVTVDQLVLNVCISSGDNPKRDVFYSMRDRLNSILDYLK